MPKILRVNTNPQTGNPKTHGYNAYDFDDIPDKYARASIFGKVVQAKKTETRTWTANTSSDPYKPPSGTRKLRTEDYGNYVKLRGEVDGQAIYEISSHHKPNTLKVSVGDEVKPKQIIAESGKTGNVRAVGGGDGTHEHKEFRNADNKAIAVEFVEDEEEINEPPPEDMDKRQLIIDAYLALRPNQPPSEDEINARLQKNENPKQLIEDIISGDGKVKEYWLEKWGVTQEDINQNKLIDQYQNTIFAIKEVLRRVDLLAGADSEVMIAKMEGVVDELLKLREQKKPIYKYQDKDYEVTFNFFGLLLIAEKKKRA